MKDARKAIRCIVLGLAIAGGLILTNTRKATEEKGFPRDYPEIATEGTLRAVTEYNAISYHVTGDTLQGFDYELLHAFARDKGLRLEITPEMSFEQRITGIQEGRYDVLATGTAVTTPQKDSLLFAHPLLLGKQVLVQRKQQTKDDSTYIRNQLDLAYKTLHVCKGSPALLRLHNLISEIADTIYIEEVSQYGPEQLLAMVAGGDIDYAVCDESIAQASIRQFPGLDIHTDISFTQFYAWAVSRHSPALLDSLNVWIDSYSKTKAYKQLYRKYFN